MKLKPTTKSDVVGRFAPSPTGPLHLGSLVTALASFLAAKHQSGQWLVRIEDTDHERCSSEHTLSILSTLEAFGLRWDRDVRYQSKHIKDYDDALVWLKEHHIAFACACTRKSLQQYARNHLSNSQPNNQHGYPNICNHKNLAYANNNIRVGIPANDVCFIDLLQGAQKSRPSLDFGAPLIKRRNGIYNYVFTSVFDDANQGVNQVVRGIDLLELTGVQLALHTAIQANSCTGFCEQTQFAHLPIVINSSGQKLSKQNKARAINIKNIPSQLNQLLSLLKQRPVDLDTPENMLLQATNQWDITALKGLKTVSRDEI